MTAVIVTRPPTEAGPWLKALAEGGWNAHPLPLIDISPPAELAALQAARQKMPQYDAVMFVSAQAVRYFLDGMAWPGQVSTRAWAPGPGTAAALLAAGVPRAAIDQPEADAAQFDSEALWRVVAPQVHQGHALLVVRGESVSPTDAAAARGSGARGNGREWLAAQCTAAGGVVDWCVAYRRLVPVWDGATRARAEGWAAAGATWLFSSSEAVDNLRSLCPQVSWKNCRALTTHERIARSVRQMGFAEVICTRPAVTDVLHGLESMHKS